MKKTLTSALCLVMLVTLLAGICGCDIFSAPKAYGRYFATADDMIEHFNPADTAAFDAIRKPNDERFVDCGYLAYDYGDDSPWYVLAFYEVEINGESVYVVFFSYMRFNDTFKDDAKPLIKLTKPVAEETHFGYLFNSMGVNIELNDKELMPKGFVKEINDGTVFTVEEFIENSNWFGFSDDNYSFLVEEWAIYDPRDVPQAEKEALASELMEILYNNYKLAGEKTK